MLVDHYIQYSAASKYGIAIPKPSQLKAIYTGLQEILNLLNISASAKLELCLDYAAGSRRYSASGHEEEAQVRLEKFIDRAGVATVEVGRVKARKGREIVSAAQDEFLLLIRIVNQHGAMARGSSYEVRLLIYLYCLLLN